MEMTLPRLIEMCEENRRMFDMVGGARLIEAMSDRQSEETESHTDTLGQ